MGGQGGGQGGLRGHRRGGAGRAVLISYFSGPKVCRG